MYLTESEIQDNCSKLFLRKIPDLFFFLPYLQFYFSFLSLSFNTFASKDIEAFFLDVTTFPLQRV